MKKLGRDDVIKIAIAGTAIAAAVAATAANADIPDHLSGLVKITPECMKVCDDTRKFKDLFTRSEKLKANSNWLEDGFFSGDADAASPFTKDYLKSRRMKKIGSSIISIGGIVSSSHTAGVNVPNAAKEANAVLSTSMHMGKLGGIALEHARVEEVQTWVGTIQSVKGAKLSIRGTKLVGATVPGGSLPATIASEFAKLGVEMTTKTMCETTANLIHHAAYIEMIHKGGEGPATQIVRELFTRRSATRLFGSYDPNHYISEPAGWKAIADKIALI